MYLNEAILQAVAKVKPKCGPSDYVDVTQYVDHICVSVYRRVTGQAPYTHVCDRGTAIRIVVIETK